MSKEYYADKTRLSASMCKQLLRSPKHALKQLTDPDPPTPQMEFGKAFHLYMERGDKDMFYIDMKSKTKATRDFKEMRERSQKDDGTVALLESEMEKIENMRDAIIVHKHAGDLLNKITEHEKRIDWDLSVNGGNTKCKSLIDGIYFKKGGDLATVVD